MIILSITDCHSQSQQEIPTTFQDGTPSDQSDTLTTFSIEMKMLLSVLALAFFNGKNSEVNLYKKV
mgnify:FL=1